VSQINAEEALSICLVVDDADGLARARVLSELGWKVHVLFCGPVAPAGCSRLDDVAPPPFLVPALQASPAADRSDRVRHALEHLHRERRFDLIEFPARDGLAFRSVQARRAGLAFGDVGLVVRLSTCGQWRRDRNARWPTDVEELQVDYLERYAFEQADAQVISDGSLLDFVGRIGWAVRPAARTLADEISAYRDLVRERPWATAPASDEPEPLVTVAVTHYNLGRYLPEALASLAAQTYRNLEVLVIDDGSTDAASVAAFGRARARYPQFRFLTQVNAGPGAARNRALREGAGRYFLPVDADNVARPDMVERFATALRRRTDAAALTCYFLAFTESDDLDRGRYAYAYRPTGGPHVLASLRNLYGDTNAIYRAEALCAVGGFATDRETSREDWEAFVKLVHAGRRVDVVPEHLFYYRHREAGFSRVTDDYRNRQQVLRQFFRIDGLPAAERVALWTALASFQLRIEEFEARDLLLIYRLAAWLRRIADNAPRAKRCLKWLLSPVRRTESSLARPRVDVLRD
jgi:glycosyltransferase involved in cell wall biosynthesis